MEGLSDLGAADAEADLEAFLERHRDKGLLRFITCGSVDDGKSTLIGRLLHDSRMIFEDQLAALEDESRRHGTQGDAIDFALLVDGLSAEREQGITIDVAYRFFTTEKRKFIVADTPGHEQFTRNMVTGAANAELALILVDARKGVLPQTRRHSYIVRLLGIENIVLAVNKMDLVGYDGARFAEIVADYRTFAGALGLDNVFAVPISAFAGDNVSEPGANMDWYRGPTLIRHLEEVPLDEERLARAPFRMPVQWVNRRSQDFRGYCGTIVSGGVAPGDKVRLLPSRRTVAVDRIVTMDGELDRAVSGQSVALVFAEDVDCSRGDVASADDAPLEVADQFEADIVWMDEEAMLPGRSYVMKLATASAVATVTDIRHRIDIASLEERPARTFALNDIGVVTLALDRGLAFAPYAENQQLGGFILIDRLTNATVGAGMIRFALRRAHNIHWQQLSVDRETRAAQKGQSPKVIWFTGLSGAGKSTIANLVEKKLLSMGRHSYLLDGDNIRLGINRDLGFTDADRVENIRRIGEVAKLMADAGLIVLCAFISPFRAERRMVRDMLPEGEFWEVFVDTPQAEAERRDVKGLYAKARRGDLPNFTGIDSPYEPPEEPEVRIDTTALGPEEAADAIVARLFG
ncbi:MAG: sulfate adenylyltransferase subunit CysN [Sphingomonadaceae bacterium]